MNKLAFERDGELVIDIEASSTSDFPWGEIDICELTYNDFVNFDEEKKSDIVLMLMNIVNEIFECDPDDAIDTDITLVDDNQNFIWSVYVNVNKGEDLIAKFIDWINDENSYRYVVNEENNTYQIVKDNEDDSN